MTTENQSHASLKLEFTIDELAREGNSTVRNVRAYQDRGLLSAPERRGRTGVYSDAHLARLRLINRLLDKGYSLANIGELIDAWEKGQDLSQLMGLEAALTRPWSDEVPDYYTLNELLDLFKSSVPDMDVNAVLEKAHALEVIVPEKDRFKVPSPRLLHVGIELLSAGIPLEDMLDIMFLLRENVQRAANEIVQRIAKYVFDQHYGQELPPPEDVPGLAALIWRLRPLVDIAVQSEVARAMQHSMDAILGDRLTLIYEHLRERSNLPVE